MSALTLDNAPPPAMPSAFHLMIKPHGAICNLDCTYCFYLRKEHLYDEGASFRMSDAVLESFTRQYIEAQRVPEVTFGWQGGEPTLMGLDFFRKAVAVQEKCRPAGMKIANTLQTNGVLLDDAWCRFLKEHGFLVGLSLDGPRELHDAYRVDKGGKPTFDKVYRALKLLQKHGVEFNVLCVVNRINADHPLRVYRFFKGEGVQFIQFIPAVERTPDGGVTDWTVRAEQWGTFLCGVFDEWVRRDVGRVFVQSFDVALQAWVGMEPSLCVHAQTCGNCLAIEHNGDLFSCDHYVDADYFLGNVMEIPMTDLVASPFQRKFGRDKRDTLPRYCRECPVLFACNGGCPKDRFISTPDGEPGLHYLCAGYKQFFTHIAPFMRLMAELLNSGHPPAAIMDVLRQKEARAGITRNAPCPCGSGRKYKVCCGAQM
ncbi:MAG: anaerobic sulfatase maturase [Abditibacteriales bacterium]|nr:anaerobic sulfatase maturase [Abditibacteriales bacterium]MDW8367656.1 anaerobic sulfatase maturase [Abditibacteriales bacterium]